MKTILTLLFLFSASLYANDDRVGSFKELKEVFNDGKDFFISFERRNPSVLILTIHGGNIEVGTSLIVKEIAKDLYSEYIFESFLPEKEAWQLHLTSTHFDEPQALDLVRTHPTAISIHGFEYLYEKDAIEPPALLLGGLNMELRQIIDKKLGEFKSKYLPQLIIEPGQGRFAGMSERNIVNHPQFHGVQLELSRRLRDEMIRNPLFLKLFSHVLRDSIFTYGCENTLRLK